MRTTVGRVVLMAVAVVLAVTTAAPVIWMFSASLMPTGEANTYPPSLFPSRVTFAHYIDLFTRLNLSRYVFNSVFLSVTVTAISLLLNSMAGYGFAKFRFRGNRPLFSFLVMAMVIPSQVSTLPLFLLMKKLGFVNTYMGIIIPGLTTIFGIFLMRQYIVSIPDSLIEAARIDGASEFRIYWSLILPLCRPMLITLAMFTFMGTWNDFLWPLIVMTDDTMYTLPVALANLVGEHVQDTELMMAGSVITILPLLVIFLSMQKYYIGGLMSGGVKE